MYIVCLIALLCVAKFSAIIAFFSVDNILSQARGSSDRRLRRRAFSWAMNCGIFLVAFGVAQYLLSESHWAIQGVVTVVYLVLFLNIFSRTNPDKDNPSYGPDASGS